MTVPSVTIIGGGLAGTEAAWQLLKRGHSVTLFEMKPIRFSPAHSSPQLAELVCSNSLRSNMQDNAVGLLKEEMRRLQSLIMEAADATAVPAGRALAVERSAFSSFIEDKLSRQKNLTIIREEIRHLPQEKPVIIATGPLTSDALAKTIVMLTGQERLYFYDAIAPIIDVDSIDMTKVFRASRYDQTEEGDYLNCPLTEQEYTAFLKALMEGDEVPLKPFEDPKYFEGCLPIEIMAGRGPQTLAFGPMKPVGLIDPQTGQTPYAVVQLRSENREGSHFNMVGFQTKLTWPEQQRIFRMIPGLKAAEFSRYGSIHRNTFIHSPSLLDSSLQLQSAHGIYFSGQITGVEGYVESAAMGLLAGLNVASSLQGKDLPPPPKTTAMGALLHHVTDSEQKRFQPSNVHFGLFSSLSGRNIKRLRGGLYAKRALEDLEIWRRTMAI